MRIALMITCLGDVMRPRTGQATVHVLRRLGHELDFPEAQTCCGQPMYNSGFADLARQQAKHTIEVFEDAETVVTPSGSCAAMVKVEYPHLFEDDPEWLARSQALAAKTFEFSDFLVNQLGVCDVGARYDGTVAYHFACHLRMLNQQDEVEQLIRNVAGTTLLPIHRQDQCCGFGGSFAIRYPKISTNLVEAKMQSLVEAGAQAVVSTDAGCLMNIGGKLHRARQTIEILHIAELLERR